METPHEYWRADVPEALGLHELLTLRGGLELEVRGIKQCPYGALTAYDRARKLLRYSGTRAATLRLISIVIRDSTFIYTPSGELPCPVPLG